jgi:hypothetical protein
LRHRSLRRLAEATLAVLAVASVVAMASKTVGEGEAPPLAQAPSTSAAGPGGPTVVPTPFAKQAVVGTDKAPPSTAASDAPSGGVTLRPSGRQPAAGSGGDAPVTDPPTTSGGGPGTTRAAPPSTEASPPPGGLRCIVRLHGKGGGGSGTRPLGDDLVEIGPSGNGSAWGGREWRYFPQSAYASARATVASAIDAAGCGRVVIDGFSNGGAFAAKLYCRGETFGGRLVGVVVDDPVADHGVEGCAAAGGVRIALYWTGALDGTSLPGWNCAEQDWTCEGGTTIGIDAYQAALGVTRRPSVHGTHAWFQEPPELRSWW